MQSDTVCLRCCE